MITYFVTVAMSDEEIDRVEALTLSICEAARMRFGATVSGWLVNFRTLAALRQSYWDARSFRRERQLKLRRSDPVIRINDIPFAEAVFPALFAWYGGLNGYTVLIEDIPWDEVGPALVVGRINVAIYPEFLKSQVLPVRNKFPDRLLVRSEPLLEYHDYPVIRNSGPVSKPGHIGVPTGSDFDLIASDLLASGHFEAVDMRGPQRVIVKGKIHKYKSADEVLARVADGELEYGLVGGLQGEYAKQQFGKNVAGGAGPLLSVCAFLNPRQPNPCYLWAAPTTIPQGEKLLKPLIALWNEAVMGGWRNLSTIEANEDSDESDLPKQRRELVAMVNSQSHCSFVEDFQQLNSLVRHHDANLGERVKDEISMILPALGGERS
jgi:hypothetical protein